MSKYEAEHWFSSAMTIEGLADDLNRLEEELCTCQRLLEAQESKLKTLANKYKEAQSVSSLMKGPKLRKSILEATNDCLSDTGQWHITSETGSSPLFAFHFRVSRFRSNLRSACSTLRCLLLKLDIGRPTKKVTVIDRKTHSYKQIGVKR